MHCPGQTPQFSEHSLCADAVLRGQNRGQVVFVDNTVGKKGLPEISEQCSVSIETLECPSP